MSNFIQRLVLRQHTSQPPIRPRMRSRFETANTQNELKRTSTQADLNLPLSEQQALSENTPTNTSKQQSTPSTRPIAPISKEFPQIKVPLLKPIQEAQATSLIKPIPIQKAQKISLPNLKPQQLDSADSQIVKPQLIQKNQASSDAPTTRISQRPQIVKSNIVPKKERAIPYENHQSETKKTEVSDRNRQKEKTIIQPLIQSIFKRKSPLSNQENQMRKQTMSTPTIKINIGRIEVKAIVEPPSPVPSKKRTKPQPNLTLEAYLKKR